MFDELEKAMDLIVNGKLNFWEQSKILTMPRGCSSDYHQAFNTAIQTFSTVVENISGISYHFYQRRWINVDAL